MAGPTLKGWGGSDKEAAEMLGKGVLYKHFLVICYPALRRINTRIYHISTSRVP